MSTRSITRPAPFWGLRRGIDVPLQDITEIRVVDSAAVRPGFRSPGMATFNRLVGTFRKRGDRQYWSATRRGPSLLIKLRIGDFNTLVLDVDNPETALQSIREAMAAA